MFTIQKIICSHRGWQECAIAHLVGSNYHKDARYVRPDLPEMV
jgi:hypothetical protein